MITLDLSGYCHHGCMRFDPLVAKQNNGDTVIRCKNYSECRYMIRYLKNYMNEDMPATFTKEEDHGKDRIITNGKIYPYRKY